MAKRGRPTKFTEGILNDVEKLAQIFCSTDKDIAAFVGVEPETLCRWKRKHPEISQYIERGRSLSKISLQTRLFKLGEEGNLSALIFILTNKFSEDWQDRRAVVNNTVLNKVNVNKEFTEEDKEFSEKMREYLRKSLEGNSV